MIQSLFRRMIASAFIFIPFSSFAQNETDAVLQLEQKLEQNTGTGEESPDLSDLTSTATELIDHPVNLNKAGVEELRTCGLFSETQVAALLSHREKYGSLLAIFELQVIEGFTEIFIRQIQQFVTTGNTIDDPNASFGRMVREGQHQLIMRWMQVPEKKKGYDRSTDSPEYTGSAAALYTRYRFQFMKKLSWGITAEKDAGEQFFRGAQKKGFDFYSAHFAYRNFGCVKTIVIGDFQLDYGQGLTLSTGLSGGKPADPVTIKKNAQGIRPYTSTNEVFFKRGAAVALRKHNWTLDLFLSRRKLDGNINSSVDTLTANDLFTSFQESGYHRTSAEVVDKNAIGEWFYGSHLRYAGKTFQSGVTIVNTRFELPLVKNLQSYNRFEFQGTSLMNIGWDYAWLYRNLNFFGEMSRSQNGTLAHVHGLVASVDPRLGVAILYRHYPRNYQVLYSGAIKESGNNYNEQGIYAGINFRPARVIGITCSYDRFYFPWLRYLTNAPSSGYEFSGLFTYNPSRKTEVYVRYRKSYKNGNTSLDNVLVKYLTPTLQQGIRFHVTSKISKKFTLRTRVEFVKMTKDGQAENGMVVFQDIQYHPMAGRISFNLRYALFDTDGYDSRIYAYENDVLYGYSIPAYYYKGSRIYFNTRIRVAKGIDAWLRYAATFYSNRNSIGSGYEEIKGSRRSEVKMQVRFLF